MVETSNKPVFSSCGGDLVIWEEDSLQKKFSISKRCPVSETSSETSDNSVTSVCWSEDNKYIACVNTSANEVCVINSNDLSLKDRISYRALFEGHSSNGKGVISCVCFVGSGDQILVGSSEGLVRLWDTETTSPLKLFQGYSSPVFCITCRIKSSLLVAGLEDGCIVFHNMSASAPTAPTVTLSTSTVTEEPIKECVHKVTVSPFDHKLLASCGSSGCVRLWSTESHRLLTTFKQPHTKMAYDVVFSPYNRKLMASVGGDGKIYLYDIQQRKQLTQLSCHVGLCSLLLMKDGVTMVTGGIDGNVYFYNLKNCQKPEYVISVHKGIRVNSMAVQHVIKSSSGGINTSRKLPGKQMKKSSSKVTFQDVDPVLQLQTPSPVQGPASFTTPMVTGSEGTGNSTQKELSGIFSPLDVPYSSYVPKSTGQPSTGTVPTTDIRLTDTNNVLPTNDDTMTATIPPVQQRPLPPSWPTPLPSHLQSTSISSVFSPLDSAHSSSRPVIPTTTSIITNGIDSNTTGATGTTDTAGITGITNTTGTNGNSNNSDTVPITTATKTSSTSNRPKHTLSKSPVPKKPGSPRPKSKSPTANSSSNKGADSVSLSKLDSTSIVKENPGGHGVNSSTLLNNNMQSHLPSPDIQSTPMGGSQYPVPAPNHQVPLSYPPTSIITSHSAPSVLPLSATPITGGGVPPVHMQYLENLIKESQEETCSIIHRDIRNLSVSMIRQFSTLENQMVNALTAISERVDKATVEIEQLKHQVDHLTPKY